MVGTASGDHEVSAGLSDDVYERLRRQAALNNRTVEEELSVLADKGTTAQADSERENLAEVIHDLFAPIGGLSDLESPSRKRVARWAEFGS